MLRDLKFNVGTSAELIGLLHALANDYLGQRMLENAECLEVRVREPKREHRRRKVLFGVPVFHYPQTGVLRPMAIKIPNDAIATVPLIVDDAAGHPLAPDTVNVSATVADASIATAAVTSDGKWVQITPLVATGASTVTYRDADDNITATLDFSIVVPSPSSASFDEANTVLTANPNPPAGAVGGAPATGTGTGTGTDTGTGTGTGTTGTGTDTGTGTVSGAAGTTGTAGTVSGAAGTAGTVGGAASTSG